VRPRWRPTSTIPTLSTIWERREQIEGGYFISGFSNLWGSGDIGSNEEWTEESAMAKTKQVFISYATKDAEFAHRLADDLKRLGVPVWIAPESIRPGESWVSAIERGLEESSHVVVVLTPAALESRWVKKETDIAIARERKGRIQVIPLNGL
jgi:hypothetical protein